MLLATKSGVARRQMLREQPAGVPFEKVGPQSRVVVEGLAGSLVGAQPFVAYDAGSRFAAGRLAANASARQRRCRVRPWSGSWFRPSAAMIQVSASAPCSHCRSCLLVGQSPSPRTASGFSRAANGPNAGRHCS